MTAFEPSGDALGAMAAKGVFARDDSVRIVGLGGKEMEEAGVELLAHTSDEAAMGLHALGEVMRVKQRNKLLHQEWKYLKLIKQGFKLILTQI